LVGYNETCFPLGYSVPHPSLTGFKGTALQRGWDSRVESENRRGKKGRGRVKWRRAGREKGGFGLSPILQTFLFPTGAHVYRPLIDSITATR